MQATPMMFRVPWPIRKLFGSVCLWEMPSGSKTIYLSFDDGPDPLVTPGVLDILSRYGARATFFMLGEKAERHPDLVSRVLERGHSIGVHGYTHMNGFHTPAAAYLENALRCRPIISSDLYRPPYGKLTPLQLVWLRRHGFRVIMWTMMAYDFRPSVSASHCLAACLRQASDGAIMVFHDNALASAKLLQVLPDFLMEMSDRGYSFAGIP